MQNSWKTTLGGLGALLAAIGTLGNIAIAFANGEPVSWEQIGVAVLAVSAAWGLLFARDNDVTSAEAGAE